MARVLIIEDNEVSRELMRYLLVAFRHEVSTAVDGETALLAIDRQVFDLIVCDVHMPKMDGLQFLKAVHAQTDRKLPPIIAVTASAMVGDRETLLRAGFDNYISKPIDPQTFVGQLEACIGETKR